MDALSGLPLMQRWLYMVLRWHMDKRTCMVGYVRGISLQGLAEELYVEPVRGRHAADTGSPTKKAIRSALDGLERAGLISPRGNGEVLVFLLTKARGALVRKNYEGHMRGTDEGHDYGACGKPLKTRSTASKSVQEKADEWHDEGQGSTNDEGHTSSIKVNHRFKKTSSSALCTPVDKKLSTEAPLMMTDDFIADWLNKAEAQRGKVAAITSQEVRSAGWTKRIRTFDDIRRVYQAAVAARKKHRNQSAINLPYLDSILTNMLSGRESAEMEGGRNASPGISATGYAEAEAKRLGIAGRMANETDAAFVCRISTASAASRLGLAPQRSGETQIEFESRVATAKSARAAKRSNHPEASHV